MKTLIKKILPKGIIKLYHKYLSLFASFYYGNPSEKMIVIGVTGTKGKSSTSYLLAKIIENSGHKVGLCSTINFKIGDKEWINDKKMTMLGRMDLQKLLKQMVEQKCEYAVVETSSEGIAQFRHFGINYDIAVFTNLTPEHLEAHGGFENYKNAKLKLFSHLTARKNKIINNKKIEKQMVVNLDSEFAKDFLQCNADKKIGYKIIEQQNKFNLDALITANEINLSDKGTSFSIDSHLFETKLLGLFNVYNCLAAISSAYCLGISFDKIKNALSQIEGIPGRMEFIKKGQNFKVIVDYAHEPASLKALYNTVFDAKLVKDQAKIIHLIGSAGGGRDHSRRPVLGKIAGENANIVIVANEDPYDDDPQTIIEQVAEGAKQAGKIFDKDLFMIMDRRDAIKKALSLAKQDDLVLITGKGSEQAIVVENNKKMPWDDRVVAGEELKKFSQ